jgi:hypothetical protein
LSMAREKIISHMMEIIQCEHFCFKFANII